jgi:hypothetical protein
LLVSIDPRSEAIVSMKKVSRIVFAVLLSALCMTTFAADKPSCKKTGKNCPMNENGKCNCGKDCSC